MKNLPQIVSRLKRKSPVDILFHTGLMLLAIGIPTIFILYNTGYAWLGAIIVIFGLLMIIYGVIKYEFFCRKDPYSLMPSETQVQNRMLNLLGDNTNPKTISAVTNAVKTMSVGIGDKQRTIKGEEDHE